MYKGTLEITNKETGEIVGNITLPTEKKVTKIMKFKENLEQENPNLYFYLTINEVKE